MKKRIFSLLVVLVMAVSVIIGVSLTSSAADGDGLKNSAISLAENVTLKMEVAIAEPVEGSYAKVTLPGGAVDATQLVANAPKAGNNYVFFAEVAVKDLAKNVTIEICNADGSTLVAAATTSALAYCDAYTEGEFLGLVTALKAYANAADYYFDAAKTADSAAAADFAAIADVATAGTLPAGITHRSATLILESETTIRHYFELAEGKDIADYTFSVGNEKLAPKAKTTEDGETVYYVDVENLTPNMLDNVYTVAVTDGTDTYTCDYGVLTYLKRAYATGDVDTKNLAAALLDYNTEAGKLKGTITFNAGGGSAVADQTYEYGVNTSIVAPTTKTGYSFIGWFDEYGTRVSSIPSNATGNITLNAKWGLTYFYEDFSADTAQTITAGGSVGNLAVNGNNGNSWFDAKDGYLKWTVNKAYGTASPNNNNIRSGESDVFTMTIKIARENGTNVGHVQLRFRDSANKDLFPFTIDTNSNSVKVDGTAIMSVPEIKNGFATLTVTFDFANGKAYYYDGDYTLLKEQTLTVPSGSSAANMSEFRKILKDNAPNFYCPANIGADRPIYFDSIEIREGKVDYKVTSSGKGTVTFNSDGGSAVDSMEYVCGVETPITAVPTKSGYSFIGWFDKDGTKYNSIPEDASGDIELTAKWGKTYLYEDFSTNVSTPVEQAGTIGSLSVNGSNGSTKFSAEDGHLVWTTTGKYATASPSNNAIKEAESDLVTITLVMARANGAIVPHIDYRFRANNGSGNVDVNVFTINTNDNNVKANGKEIVKIPEAKDGYVTLKLTIDFSSGLVSFYDANEALIYSYTPTLPSGYASFSAFRTSLTNNAPNLYVSNFKSGSTSVLYIDSYEIREGGVY